MLKSVKYLYKGRKHFGYGNQNHTYCNRKIFQQLQDFLTYRFIGMEYIQMNAKPKFERINLSPMPYVDENFYLEYNNVLTSEGFEFSGDYSVIIKILSRN